MSPSKMRRRLLRKLIIILRSTKMKNPEIKEFINHNIYREIISSSKDIKIT
jgi:hypothetical protein